MQTKLELLWYFFGSREVQRVGQSKGQARPAAAWLHAQENLGALIAWQQRDVVDGGTEHGYRELYRPNAA
jgi:hypothetical protein